MEYSHLYSVVQVALLQLKKGPYQNGLVYKYICICICTHGYMHILIKKYSSLNSSCLLVFKQPIPQVFLVFLHFFMVCL